MAARAEIEGPAKPSAAMRGLEILRGWFPGVDVRLCPMYFPQFAVLPNGEIYNLRDGTPKMVNLLDKPGTPYKRVSLNGDVWAQHIIVCVTFHGARPEGVDGRPMEVRHRDGNGANNAASNLEWGTRIENEHDKYRHGTRRRRVR